MIAPGEWIIYRNYTGYWCDNCQTVWPVRNGGRCRDCGAVEVRPVDVVISSKPEPKGPPERA